MANKMKCFSVLCVYLVVLSAFPALGAPPANDSFANAVALSGTFDVEAGTNLDATNQPGERPETGDFTVWYKWTAPATGRGRFSVQAQSGSPFNRARLSIWLGSSVATLDFIGAREAYSAEALLADVPVFSGLEYYICVGSYGDALYDRGAFDCSVVLETNRDLNSRNVVAASAQNDLFSQATPLLAAC